MSAPPGAGPVSVRTDRAANDFFNSEAVRQDGRAKSLSFYSTGEVVHVNREVVRQLVEASSRDGRGRARLCLHKSPDSKFHEMIVVEHRGGYFRPHKHLAKGESCVLIEGSAAFFVFGDDGAVTHVSVVGGPQGELICRVEANQWHTVIPLTPYAVYLESKPGPFLGANDRVYPDWAPDGSDSVEAAGYLEALLSLVGRGAPTR